MTFVNDSGDYLEVPGDFAMTKQAISILGGVNIKGDVSLNFSVDNNSVNRKALKYYGPQMTSQVAFTRQAFSRMKDGNILDRGYIVIQDELEEYLDCFYIAGNSNWIQLLQTPINQLNFLDFNTPYYFQNILASFSATSGIIFPMVDWSQNFKKGNNQFWAGNVVVDSRYSSELYHVNDFYPCFYLHSLMDSLMSQNSLKLTGDLLNDPLYKAMIITPSNGKMKRDTLKNIYAIGSAQSITNDCFFHKYTSFTEVSDPENLFASSTYTANRYARVKVTITASTMAGLTAIDLFKNGSDNSVDSLVDSGTLGLKGSWNVVCNSGDTLDIYVRNCTGGATSVSINILIEIPEMVIYGDIVNPSHFLPSITGIEFVKFVFTYFACAVYFNDVSKTITANIIDNIKLESSADWSNYHLSHRNEYTVDSAKNNYLKLAENSDSQIKSYNDAHLVNFGEGIITTDNTLITEATLATFPIKASLSDIGINNVLQTSVPLINLVDEGDPIAFTAVSVSVGIVCDFTIPATENGVIKSSEILRIVNSSGQSLGYFQTFIGWVTGGATVQIYFASSVTSFAGYLFKQTVNYQDVGFRVLAVRPNSIISDLSSSVTNFSFFEQNNPATPAQSWRTSDLVTWNVATTESSMAFAAFSKQQVGLPIDKWPVDCAIDNPDLLGYSNQTVKELKYNKISNILNKPHIRFQMLIPSAIYQSFDFSTFVYVKTKDLTGYFFIESIVNYVDGNTPVEVNAYML